MRYEKKRHESGQDEIARPQQALVIWERYAASQVKGIEQVSSSENIESPSDRRPRSRSQGCQGEQSQSGGYEITICHWLPKRGRQLRRHNTWHHKHQPEEPKPMQQQNGF